MCGWSWCECVCLFIRHDVWALTFIMLQRRAWTSSQLLETYLILFMNDLVVILPILIVSFSFWSRRIFGSTGACSACGQTIPASEFVMRSGGPSPQQPGAPPHVFHLKCFACSKCGAHLVPGDRYYMLAGSLVCEQDWHKLLKSSTGTTVRKGKVGRPRRSRDWADLLFDIGKLKTSIF